jgi:hypothetical protein
MAFDLAAQQRPFGLGQGPAGPCSNAARQQRIVAEALKPGEALFGL